MTSVVATAGRFEQDRVVAEDLVPMVAEAEEMRMGIGSALSLHNC